MNNDGHVWLRLLQVGWVLGMVACGGAEMDGSTTNPLGLGASAPCAPDAGAHPTPAPGPSQPPAPAPSPPAPTTPPDGPRPMPAGGKFIALTQAQLNKLGSGNRQVDPSTLVVFLANRNLSCSDPFKIGEPYCGHWSVSFRLPPAYQREGSWHIEEEPFNSFMSYALSEAQGPNCGGGAGSITYGELNVLEFGARTLVVRLDDVRTREVDMSGTYTVERCPDATGADGGAQ